jgi:ArsR family transcriptional regulator, arsenate/arsenite/antimonite-responsive transcriptional repressor / arsenate reductase (thioredoxin)
MIVEISRSALDIEERAAAHAALGDPVRLAIVDELSASDRTPTELGRLTGTPSNLMAHHLRVLEQRGIVERRRSIGDGRRTYLRLVTDRLGGLIVRPVMEAESVLFVCTRNSARSQLAAAMWNRGPRTVRAESAGTHPDGRVHPGALRAARRRGLDLSQSVPRALEGVAVRRPLIVTVCDQAREELGHRVAIHWSVADPVASGTREAFDEAADEIGHRVERLGGLIGSSSGRAALEKEVG